LTRFFIDRGILPYRIDHQARKELQYYFRQKDRTQRVEPVAFSYYENIE
jgi:hypothetical protein